MRCTNATGKLRIDMTAQVYIILDEARNVLTVPAVPFETSNRPRKARSDADSSASEASNNPDASNDLNA